MTMTKERSVMTEKKEIKSRFKSWREWAVLSNTEKTKLYPKLNAKEKEIIWCKEYMKIVPLNTKPLSEVMKSNEFTD